MTLTEAEFKQFLAGNPAARRNLEELQGHAARHFDSSGAGSGSGFTGSRSASAPEVQFEADWRAAAALLGLDADPGGATASQSTTPPGPMLSISKQEVERLRADAAHLPNSEAEWEHWAPWLGCA